MANQESTSETGEQAGSPSGGTLGSIRNYILKSIEEVKDKVSWSSFAELQSSAILVLVASVIFAIIIGLVDLGFQNVLGWFYREF